jgi:hypothetical protein
VLGRFSDPEPFLAAGNSFRELTNFSQGPEQNGTGDHREQVGSADTLAEAIMA